jgi:hypothetical protein
MLVAPDRRGRRCVYLVVVACGAVAALIAVIAAMAARSSGEVEDASTLDPVCHHVAVARAAPPVAPVPPVPVADPPPELTPDDVAALIATIAPVGDHRFEVPQRSVDQVLANPMVFARSARIVPAVRARRPFGFGLHAIQPTSVFTALGFHDGDVIRAINGLDLTLADKSLELYTRLRAARQYAVDVDRRGRPLVIEIDIK